MKYIEETLNQQGLVKWTQGPKGAPDKAIEVSDQVLDAKADASACTLSFKADHRFPDYQVGNTWTVPLRDIDKITVESATASAERFRAERKLPPWGSTMTPDVFSLEIYAVGGKPFAMQRRSVNKAHETTDQNRPLSPAPLIFREKQVAEQIAEAIRTAKELCGPGK